MPIRFSWISLDDVMAEVRREHPDFMSSSVELVDEDIERWPYLNNILRTAMLRTGADIVSGWVRLSPNSAAFSRFVVPTYRTLQGVPLTMALSVINDAITNVPLVFDNLGGVVVAKPAGSTDTVTVDNAAWTVAMGADGTSVDITPVQPAAADGTAGNITYTNSVVTTASTLAIVSTSDPNAVSDHFDTTNATTRPLGT